MRVDAIRVLAFFALSALGCEPATDPLSYEDFVLTEGDGVFGDWVQSGLYSRTYFLHTPPEMSETETAPLLIFLHGAGGTGESFHELLNADEATDSAGFITVYPDGMQGTWTLGCGECTFAGALMADDVSFLQALTRHLAEYLPIDTTQVFLMGYSQGGTLAHLYGCRSSNPPAGIGSVASLIHRNVEQDCSPSGNFPVAIVHGTGDQSAVYGGYGPYAPVLSVPDLVDMWVDRFTCDPTPVVVHRPDRVEDFTTITSLRFNGCLPGSSVLHYRVIAGGHNWPGPTGPWHITAGLHSREMDSTREILAYFQEIASGSG